MKNLKTILFTACLGLLLVGASRPAKAMRLAYVDIAEIFDQYEGTKDAKEELKTLAGKKRKDLEKKQEDLKKQLDDLQAQKSVLAKSKYEAKEEKLKGEVRDLQEQIQAVTEELQAKEKKMTKNILDEIRAIIKDVANDQKYDYVFEKNTLLFGGDDVTYQIIKKMNKK
jgi:Skp family chaperone for outer membrane proteins